MPFGVSYIITFFIGAFIGRYFENIIKGLAYIRKDLQKAQKQFNK